MNKHGKFFPPTIWYYWPANFRSNLVPMTDCSSEFMIIGQNFISKQYMEEETNICAQIHEWLAITNYLPTKFSVFCAAISVFSHILEITSENRCCKWCMKLVFYLSKRKGGCRHYHLDHQRSILYYPCCSWERRDKNSINSIDRCHVMPFCI